MTNDVQPRTRLSDAISRWAPGCCFAAIIALYAGLIPLGHWGLDEYVDIDSMRSGFGFFLDRMRWSPRPLSEPVFFAYGWLVNHLHRPLIVPFLGALWLLLLVAGFLTYLEVRRQTSRHSAWMHGILALALIAAFVAGGRPMEVFYWPAGAAAYLPTLAATLLLFLQTAAGRLASVDGRRIAGLCLVVAAGSSETGAIFVVCYTAIQAAVRARAFLRRATRHEARPMLWWVAPAALALLVLVTVRMNRFNATELSQLAPNGGLEAALSLPIGVVELAVEAVGKQPIASLAASHGRFDWSQLLLGWRFPSEALFGIGVALVWSRAGRILRKTARALLLLVWAMLMASIATIAAAERHFGIVCCDRHETMRQCWVLMSIAGFAIASSATIAESAFARRVRFSGLGTLLLCAAVLPVWQAGALIRTYGMYGKLTQINEGNFKSGFDEKSDRMVFSMTPVAGLIPEERLIPGTYSRQDEKLSESGPGSYPYHILSFFQKQTLVIPPAPDDATADTPCATMQAATCAQGAGR